MGSHHKLTIRTAFGVGRCGLRPSDQHRLTPRYETLEPRILLAGLPAIIDIVAGSVGTSPRQFTDVNNTVFFSAETPTHGRELWKTDGTSAGTMIVKDIFQGANGSEPESLTNVNGT